MATNNSINNTLDAASATSLTFTSTTGIVGTTTNNNAAAGSVGEVISSTVVVGSGVALTTATPANVTSISLTAGDWTVFGNALASASGNNMVEVYAWISTTSATLPDLSLVSGYNANAVLAFNFGANAPTVRLSLAGTTTVYLSISAQFAAGTAVGCGTIWARRDR